MWAGLLLVKRIVFFFGYNKFEAKQFVAEQLLVEGKCLIKTNRVEGNCVE